LETAPQVRLSLFKQIHEIIFHGKGGYDYDTIYNLPIWLRRFTFKEINDFYEKEASAYKSQQDGGNTSLIDEDGKVNLKQFKSVSKDYKGKSSYK